MLICKPDRCCTRSERARTHNRQQGTWVSGGQKRGRARERETRRVFFAAHIDVLSCVDPHPLFHRLPPLPARPSRKPLTHPRLACPPNHPAGVRERAWRVARCFSFSQQHTALSVSLQQQQPSRARGYRGHLQPKDGRC